MNLELMAYLTDSQRLWAIDEATLLAYTKAAETHDGSPVESLAPGSSMRSAGSVAVINVHGPISYRPNIFTALFGGAAITSIQSMFRQAIEDDTVKAIVMSYDTPGGTVTGLSEFANEIMAARGRKPIIAQVEVSAQSAGYHMASAADQIVGMASGAVGSIGVITGHADLSAALEKEGVKVTIISAGKFKSEGGPTGPLSQEAYAAIKSRVDEAYGVFVKDVAAGRGVKVSDVRNGYAEGRSVSTATGKSLGMIDRIATLDETLSKLSGRRAPAGMRAEEAENPLVAIEDAERLVLAPEGVAMEADRRRRLERF